MWADLPYPYQISVGAAWDAYCDGCIPIGAAITDARGVILATGRNRMANPHTVSLDYIAGSRLAHAEMNAMLALDSLAVDPHECTLYTTTEPCPMCAGSLLMVNIRHVCYASRDSWAGSTNLFELSPYMRGKNTRIEGPFDARFEAVLFAIQTVHTLDRAFRRGGATGVAADPVANPHPVTTAMRRDNPAGVALGIRLYRTRELEVMRAQSLPIRMVIDSLAAMLVNLETTSDQMIGAA